MPFIPNKRKKNDPGRCHDSEHFPPVYLNCPPEGGTWICPDCGFRTLIKRRLDTDLKFLE